MPVPVWYLLLALGYNKSLCAVTTPALTSALWLQDCLDKTKAYVKLIYLGFGLWIHFPFPVCVNHCCIPELNPERRRSGRPCCKQWWSPLVCVEIYLKESGFMAKKGGVRGDEIWLAVTVRMSHSSSSLDLELRDYSGLWCYVWSCACTPVFTWLTKLSSLPAACVCVCVLEENESSLVTKPQHRSQI